MGNVQKIRQDFIDKCKLFLGKTLPLTKEMFLEWFRLQDEPQDMKEEVACLLVTSYFFAANCPTMCQKFRQKAQREYNNKNPPSNQKKNSHRAVGRSIS